MQVLYRDSRLSERMSSSNLYIIRFGIQLGLQCTCLFVELASRALLVCLTYNCPVATVCVGHSDSTSQLACVRH